MPRTRRQPDVKPKRQTPPKTSGAILTPMIDLLCCGGLSILVIVGIFVVAIFAPNSIPRTVRLSDMVILSALLNWPHFMASYRLLYSSAEDVRSHRLASVYVPALLVAIGIVALMIGRPSNTSTTGINPAVDLVAAAAAYLLAWHYTGQVWGMTASFSFLAGIRIDSINRWLIRTSLFALLVWHVLWVTVHHIHKMPFLPLEVVITAYLVWTMVAVGSFVLGGIGFLRLGMVENRLPPARAVVPWIAIYFWYALVYYFPGTFIVLQLSHAMQYLIFPIRVEMNRYGQIKHSAKGASRRAWLYYAALVLVGLIVYQVPGLLTGDRSDVGLVAFLSAAISVHHYFIDGAVWRIRNPKVRRDLFAHVH